MGHLERGDPVEIKDRKARWEWPDQSVRLVTREVLDLGVSKAREVDLEGLVLEDQGVLGVQLDLTERLEPQVRRVRWDQMAPWGQMVPEHTKEIEVPPALLVTLESKA